MIIYRPTIQVTGQTQSPLITQTIQEATLDLGSTCRRDVCCECKRWKRDLQRQKQLRHIEHYNAIT